MILALLITVSAGWTQSGLPDSPTPQNNVPQSNSPLPTPTPGLPPATAIPPVASAPVRDQAQPAAEPVIKDGDTTTQSGANASNAPGSGSDELMKYVVTVNFVPVPVTVKDRNGHLVEGLLPRDFSLLENDVEQKITFFSSDPFPLSAAVIIDLGMPDTAVRRVNETLAALQGAFGPYDEIALYTYGNTVSRRQEFTAAEGLTASLRKMRTQRGESQSVPVVSGPLATGPTVNGRPLDANRTTAIPMVQKVSRVLNDAILQASRDLGERAPNRRKILFVISDGMEQGSRASYADVTKILLSRGVTLYGVSVETGAIPIVRDLNRIHLPGMGYGNVLPKYASATGGEVFPAGDKDAVESTYQRVTLEARNQYTLGYYSKAAVSGTYRNIEVRVNRPNLQVLAKDGYYPLPPATARGPKP